MGVECAYSFWDLFTAVHSREATDEEKQKFYSMSQNMKNREVAKWAELAKWQIDKRIGMDGQVYFAFAPSFKDAC